MQDHSSVTHQHFIRFPKTVCLAQWCTLGWREAPRVKCFAKEQNTMTQAGFKPRPLTASLTFNVYGWFPLTSGPKLRLPFKKSIYHTTRSSKPLHFALLSQHLLVVFALHFLLFLFQWLVVLPHPLFLGSLPLLLAASNYLKKYIWQTFRNFLWVVCNKG